MPRTIETVTGRSLADWQAIVRDLGLTRHGEILRALKAEDGRRRGPLRASTGMTGHAVWLADPAELDDEVRAWPRAAYDRS